MKKWLEAEAIGLQRLIPFDHIQLVAKEIGSFDGEPIVKYEVEGKEIPFRLITFHGEAGAIRKGALAPFCTRYIASVEKGKLRDYLLEMVEKAAVEAERKAERELRDKRAQAANTATRRELYSPENW